MKSLYLAVIVILSCSACVVGPPPMPDDPRYAPVITPTQPRKAPTEGSLYQEDHAISLYGNGNRHRIGDIITVVLEERTVSSKSNSVSIDKENETSLTNGSILGNTPGFKGLNLLTEIDQSRAFSGEADADQSNRLQGRISVTITDVLPNGNLVVRGEKWLTLNRGDEYIRVSGLLRPEDVTLQNTVLSTQMANARITYSGTGDLAESQDMGWLARFFNSRYWPF